MFRAPRKPRSMRALARAAVALGVTLAACSGGPPPIAYGAAECGYCRMRIGDPRFGAELITTTGKVIQFDAVECLASYYASLTDRASVRELWVSDYARPGTLIPAATARYGHVASVGTPMGRGLVAVAPAAALPDPRHAAALSLDWPQVVAIAEREIDSADARARALAEARDGSSR